MTDQERRQKLLDFSQRWKHPRASENLLDDLKYLTNELFPLHFIEGDEVVYDYTGNVKTNVLISNPIGIIESDQNFDLDVLWVRFSCSQQIKGHEGLFEFRHLCKIENLEKING